MKKMIGPLLLAIFSAGSLYAQDLAPNISVTSPSFNFGSRENTETVEHVFIIENTGDLSLEIVRTRTSCGCTVANISSKTIAPGQSAELTARLNLKNRHGMQRKHITVESNDPDTPSLQLTLMGQALKTLSITPEQVLFNSLNPQDMGERSVEIRSEVATFQIENIQSSLSQISTELEVLEPGKAYKLYIRTVPPLEAGRFQGVVTFTTDKPSSSQYSIRIIGNVAGVLSFAPQEIVIPAQSTTPLTRYAVIRPGTATAFTIGEIEVPDPKIQTQLYPMGTHGYRIQLSNIKPSSMLSEKPLRIHTDLAEMPVVEIPFRVR